MGQILLFDDLFHSLPVNGWLTLPEAKLLHAVAWSCNGPILEVGSYYGRSTCLLATFGREVYSVDPFDNFDSDLTGDQVSEKFYANLAERKITNVRNFRCKIENWPVHKIGAVGFAYLDGDHTYQGTINQIDVALEAGAKELCIHDYTDEGIQKAVAKSPLKVIEVVERMAHCLPLRTE